MVDRIYHLLNNDNAITCRATIISIQPTTHSTSRNHRTQQHALWQQVLTGDYPNGWVYPGRLFTDCCSRGIPKITKLRESPVAMNLLYIYCKERGTKSGAREKVQPPMRSYDHESGRKKGWLTNTVSVMCKRPVGMEDVSNHK